MAKRYEIQHINDVLALDEEQFERFLPYFKSWYVMAKERQAEIKTIAKECGLGDVEVSVKTNSLVWIDDGLNALRVRGATVRFFEQKEEQENG